MNRSCFPNILLIGALSLIGPDPASVPENLDWPIFRGNPLQTGVAGSSLPDKLIVRWKFKVKDAIEGTAAIVDGTVFVGSADRRLRAFRLPPPS